MAVKGTYAATGWEAIVRDPSRMARKNQEGNSNEILPSDLVRK